MMILPFAAVCLSLLLFSPPSWAAVEPQKLSEALSTVRYQSLFKELRKKGFSQSEIAAVFLDERVGFNAELAKRLKFKTPAGPFNYFSEGFGLLNKESLASGKYVANRYEAVFQKAEKEYGVDRFGILAIMRVESYFGKYLGNELVVNNLNTVFFHSKRRSDWAKKELVSLFLIAREKRVDVFELKGSWAGAFGIVQFVPSSYRLRAVDGNGDGKIDLFDFEDAIKSAANYLKAAGYRSGDAAAIEGAVFRYNHSRAYVRAIMAYREAIRGYLKKGGT
ncbi:MAG: lytic murein transglycosylase [Parcubacteria group bacterium]|nr:lytic murein transglycosylase [Parcubacteria group bacterium]